MTMTIDKPKGQVSMPFTWDISSVLMGDLLGLFGITMDYFKFNDIGFDSTKLEGITFNGAAMKGQLNPDESYQIVCKASVSFSQAIKSGDVYLILTRPAGQVTKPAVIIDIRDIFNIGEALEVFIRQSSFISDFGMIGRIERDCIIMLAKEEITMVDNDEINKLISPFITEHDTRQIPKGVNVRVKVPMKGINKVPYICHFLFEVLLDAMIVSILIWINSFFDAFDFISIIMFTFLPFSFHLYLPFLFIFCFPDVCWSFFLFFLFFVI